eukprot:3363843-Prorocentrum_lima.AAC.1
MSLKAVLIRIGNHKQGIVPDLYSRTFRWNGTSNIVDLMAGTDVVKYNEVTRRLQHTYMGTGNAS